MRFLNLILSGLIGFFKIVMVRPTTVVGRFLFRLALPFYRLSFNARHRTGTLRTGTRRRALLSILTSRYVVHATVLTLTLGIAVNNVSARGAGLSDVSGDSVLSKLVSPNYEEEGDVVEGAPAPKVAYVGRQNAISPESSLEAEIGVPEDLEQSIVASGDALQVPIPSAEGVQQRSDVTTYVVQGGDTLGGIANRYAVTQKTILAANNLSNGDFIKPGQELLIPPITGVLHKVAKGDTIASIAQKYKADTQDILDFNRLGDPSAISVDQTLIVPGGEIPEAIPERPVVTPGGRNQPRYAGPVPGPAPAIGGGKLNWPTVGRKINQYFRYGHTGIDAECGYGNPIYAARSGTVSAVIYARYGYGYHIVVNHGGGLQTLYGHNSKIFVKPGQKVNQGQTIAMCGSTGRSTGTHVHFETWVNGRKVNPLTYL